MLCSWGCPSTGNLDPLGQTTALFALDINDIRVASASASDSVFFLGVPVVPVGVLLLGLLVVEVGLVPFLAGKLLSGRVGGAMVDGGMTVTDVSEVVDLGRRQKNTGSNGVNGGVSPLYKVSAYSTFHRK